MGTMTTKKHAFFSILTLFFRDLLPGFQILALLLDARAIGGAIRPTERGPLSMSIIFALKKTGNTFRC